jgi:hypothetical protein
MLGYSGEGSRERLYNKIMKKPGEQPDELGILISSCSKLYKKVKITDQ